MFGDSIFPDVSHDSIDEASTGFVMDEDAFRVFYERTARGVWAYLARLAGDRQVADDLLQETYYRFLRSSTPHESEAHSRNALYRIATNLARDARRRSMVRAPFVMDCKDIEAIPGRNPGGAPEQTAEITRALAQLKPRERAMLWLAYAEGNSHAEIAAALGLRTGSLKAMLFRARQKLGSLLGVVARGEKA